MDGAPIEVTHQVVEEHGVAVLIISFRGTYGHGSLGNGDAGRMEHAVKAIAEENPLPDVAVLDGTALDYEWGDMIGRVAVPLSGRAWVWAISERCADGLTSYVDAEQGLSPSESLFEPLAAAVAEVIRRRRAGRFMLSRLDLRGSRITDRTLARLAEGAGPSLPWVGVSGCQVSKEAGRALKAARPNLRLLG